MSEKQTLELYCSCPKCKSGIMEPKFLFTLQHGVVGYQLIEGSLLEGEIEGVITQVCSKEQCGHTIMTTTPNALLSAKKTSLELPLTTSGSR